MKMPIVVQAFVLTLVFFLGLFAGVHSCYAMPGDVIEVVPWAMPGDVIEVVPWADRCDGDDCNLNPPPPKPAVENTTTKWLGFVAYVEEVKDCIDPGFCPGDTCPDHQAYDLDVEIGLRSDGVVVWRKAQK